MFNLVRGVSKDQLRWVKTRNEFFRVYSHAHVSEPLFAEL